MISNGGPRSPRAALVAIAAAVTITIPLAACSSAETGEAVPTTSASTETIASAATTGDLPQPMQAELEQALTHTMATYGVPGAVAAVWVPGQGSWKLAAGEADVESGTPTSEDLIWPLRSVTKSFTVTLILQLADEGKLDLDDTIGQYVSGVTNGDSITLRQLAAMSSGNADYTNDAFVDAFEADPQRIFTLAELNGFMLGEPAQFEPGTEHVYTNANTNLLGAVVEQVTGQPFGEVLDARILGPLGLSSTRYLLDVTEWSSPHPTGYQPNAGAMQPQVQNLSIFGPAGSMVSTLEDQRVWAEALATGSLLEPTTQAERIQGAPLEVGPPYDTYGLGIGQTQGWLGHNGEGVGFTVAVFHNPASGATIVVFMNASKVEPKGHPADAMFRRAAAILQAS